MKPLIAVALSLLLLFGIVFWGSYGETKFQYTTYIKNVECRMAGTEKGFIFNLQEVCGPPPTLP